MSTYDAGPNRKIYSDHSSAALSKRGTIHRVQYGQIIADNLSKAGWSWGCVAAVDQRGRTIWIADAHRGDGQRFVVHADEKLTAFLELEAAIHACGKAS